MEGCRGARGGQARGRRGFLGLYRPGTWSLEETIVREHARRDWRGVRYWIVPVACRSPPNPPICPCRSARGGSVWCPPNPTCRPWDVGVRTANNTPCAQAGRRRECRKVFELLGSFTVFARSLAEGSGSTFLRETPQKPAVVAPASVVGIVAPVAKTGNKTPCAQRSRKFIRLPMRQPGFDGLRVPGRPARYWREKTPCAQAGRRRECRKVYELLGSFTVFARSSKEEGRTARLRGTPCKHRETPQKPAVVAPASAVWIVVPVAKTGNKTPCAQTDRPKPTRPAYPRPASIGFPAKEPHAP